MMPDPIVLFASVILLLPMAYFFLQAPAFLLVKLDNPTVTRLLRGMFSVYFLVVAVTGAIGTLSFAVAGRPAFAVGIALIMAFAVLARRWFLEHMDADLGARDAGDPDAVRRLRRLHWAGMLCNALQFAIVLAGIPHIADAP
jgi:hypothetical protein